MYTEGITNNYPNAIVIDYFDLYFENGKKSFETRILDILKINLIDLTFVNFVSGDLTFDLNFLKKISESSFLMMNFYDGELFFEPIERYYAQCSDLVIIPSSLAFTYNYKLLGINAISTLSLFDTSLYKKLSLEKDINISFIGDITKKSRREFIDYLILNGYQVEVYGLGSTNGKISFDKMINIFNRSKINLNFSDSISHRTFKKNLNMDYSIVPKIAYYITQLKGRSIEVALCGSFTLSQDALGLKEIFSHDQIDTFKTKEELLEKVRHYLENNTLREEMAKNAYEAAIKKFDATIQFKKILSNIDLNDKQPKTIYTDEQFISNYMTYHMLYFFNFLFKLKFTAFFEELEIIKFHKIRFYSTLQHLQQQFKFQIINKIFRKN
jgi:hypothetical protein